MRGQERKADMAETETITDTVEDLRRQLDQATTERKAAAERAKHLRFAIRNLEAAQDAAGAPAPAADLPNGEEVVATSTDWR